MLVADEERRLMPTFSEAEYFHRCHWLEVEIDSHL
jgi:hypothetical protein